MSKRFSARHIALDEYRRKQVDTWGGRAIPESEHLMVLEDYLSVSLRRRSNAYPLFKLQLALLMDVHDAEKAVAACKQKIAELEKAPEGTERDAQLESVGAEHKKFTTIRRALRDIGDGLAWRLLQYDRAALSLLATHPRKPHINLDGLSAELQALADEYNHPAGRLAVLNDLTHYLKKADITVRVDDETFEFLEVKSSRMKSATLKRQRADLEETLRFLSEGQSVNGEQVAVIRSLPVVPSSYMKTFATLIREAERGPERACHQLHAMERRQRVDGVWGAATESLVVGDSDAPRASKIGCTPVAAFRKGPLTMEIPGPWLGRVAYEFLAPRTIVAAFEAMLAAGSTPETIAWPNFSGEAEQWD